jgi:hypothetical protein
MRESCASSYSRRLPRKSQSFNVSTTSAKQQSISSQPLTSQSAKLVCYEQAQRCIVLNTVLAHEGHRIDLGSGIVVVPKNPICWTLAVIGRVVGVCS